MASINATEHIIKVTNDRNSEKLCKIPWELVD